MVERTVRGRLEPGENRQPGQRQGAPQAALGWTGWRAGEDSRGILTACSGWAGSRGRPCSSVSGAEGRRQFERSSCAQSPPRCHPQGNAGRPQLEADVSPGRAGGSQGRGDSSHRQEPHVVGVKRV